MTTMHKLSPVSYADALAQAKITTLNGMEVAIEFEGETVELARKNILGITDVSCFARYGVKGHKAAVWLSSQGISIPTEKNTWLQQNDYLVMRLGSNEFLLEAQTESSLTDKLSTLNQSAIAGVYQVMRVDAAFLLSGKQVLTLFSELCMLDLRDTALGANALVMTQLAGISATILRQQLNNEQVYRVWCDGTYGAYLWEILLEIAGELGGGAVGLSHHFQSLIRG